MYCIFSNRIFGKKRLFKELRSRSSLLNPSLCLTGHPWAQQALNFDPCLSPQGPSNLSDPHWGGLLLRTPVTWQRWSQSLLRRRQRPSRAPSHIWSLRIYTPEHPILLSRAFACFSSLHLLRFLFSIPSLFCSHSFLFLMNGLKGLGKRRRRKKSQWDFWQLLLCSYTFMGHKHTRRGSRVWADSWKDRSKVSHTHTRQWSNKRLLVSFFFMDTHPFKHPFLSTQVQREKER